MKTLLCFTACLVCATSNVNAQTTRTIPTQSQSTIINETSIPVQAIQGQAIQGQSVFQNGTSVQGTGQRLIQGTIAPQQNSGTLQNATQLQTGNPVVLSNASLREIDKLVAQLDSYTKELHDEYHQHLEGERHAKKLDEDVTALERIAEGLHRFAVSADGSAKSMARLRADANELIQMSVRVRRTIDLTEPWLRSSGAHVGINHMRKSAQNCLSVAHRIDTYLPVDTQVIDGQTERLEAAIKELHDEFHEHLEGYEVSKALDHDLESIESHVEHMHELAHNKAWGQIDFSHLMRDISEVKQRTAHIESMFVRQAQIGVRTRDWVGIEHSRDAITDVLASAYLLEHMIRKTMPQQQIIQPQQELRPRRDRHGHPVRDRQQHDLHQDHRFQSDRSRGSGS